MDPYDKKIKKVYNTLHEHFKTIKRDQVIDIVKKLDDVADIYFEELDLSPKDIKQINNSVLSKKILSNKKCPEPNTTDTILSYICAVYHFKHIYDHYPEELFKHTNLWDYVLCASHKFNFKNKRMWIFSDDDIPDTVEWFLSLPIEDIRKYRKYVQV